MKQFLILILIVFATGCDGNYQDDTKDYTRHGKAVVGKEFTYIFALTNNSSGAEVVSSVIEQAPDGMEYCGETLQNGYYEGRISWTPTAKYIGDNEFWIRSLNSKNTITRVRLVIKVKEQSYAKNK